MECRDSLGYFNQSLFNLWTCSLCYTYLFPKDRFVFNYDRRQPGLTDTFEAVYSPDIENRESLSPICGKLDVYDCERWTDCCVSARLCCLHQIQAPARNDSADAQFCPRTWDGWSCFDDTPAGTKVERSCPNFIKYGYLQGSVVKECTTNATWGKHHADDSGNEWTDYSKCIDIKGKKGVVYAGLLASSLSLILLIPATTIFLSYRQLRAQQRIQLHVCLLCSFIVYCIMKLIWTVVVYNDRIDNPWQDTFMVRKQTTELIILNNSNPGLQYSQYFDYLYINITFKNMCKVVYVLWRYARCTTFFSMFCEGLFLYRLLVHAFNSPKHIKPYFVVAWGFPILPMFLYSLMRGFFANDICWIKNHDGFEWILTAPNLLCIVVNMFFLLKILRILLTQLHQHPNEPNNYRRALRATFVLVPLFGLQLFLVVYRPTDASIQDLYEILSTIISDFQGGIIALVFCYFNGEVLHCIKLSVTRLRNSKRLPSFATSYSVVTQKMDADTKHKQQNCSANAEQIQLDDLTKRNGEVNHPGMHC